MQDLMKYVYFVPVRIEGPMSPTPVVRLTSYDRKLRLSLENSSEEEF